MPISLGNSSAFCGILRLCEASIGPLKHQKMEAGIMYEKEIELKIQKLPEDLRREVLDYVEFLLNKYKEREKAKNKLGFDWEGGLSDLKEKFTSVKLQHKSLEWR